MLKMYIHAVVALITAALYFLLVPKMFSADSDMAVLVALGITIILPVVVGFYIKHFFGKKTSVPEESNSQ